MKNVFTLLIVVSLLSHAHAQEIKTADNLVSDLYSSPTDIGFSKIQQSLPNCSVPKKNRLLGSSQSKLVNFFKNISCEAASRDILGDLLSADQCKMVNDCQTAQKKLTPISADDDKLLSVEVMDFVIRENVRSEMAKYQKKEAKELKELMAYAEKMPDEYKTQINFCDSYNNNPDKCLNEELFDNVAKHYLTSFYSEDERDSMNSRSAALPGASQLGLMQSLNFNPSAGFNWRAPLEQKFEAKKTQRLYESKDASSDVHFKNIIKLEKEWSDKIKAATNSFVPEEDELLNEVVSAVILSGGKISEEEMKEKVKVAIHKYAQNGRDLILSHSNKNVSAAIDKALEKLDFDINDFVSPDRKSLSKKMNGLRVQVANGILVEECSQRVVSFGQMCGRVSENMMEGKAGAKSVDDTDIFNRMIASYNTTKSKDPDRHKKTAALARMGMAKDKVYNRFINLMFNTTSCKEKYPGTIRDTKDDAQVVKEHLKSLENYAKESKASAYRDIVEIVNKNDELRREFVSSGYKFEGIKKDFVPVDTIKASQQNTDSQTLNSAETISSNLKSFVSEGQQAVNNNSFANQPAVRKYDLVNSEPVIEEKKADDKAMNDNQLAERLKALEKKESNLRKKMAAENSADVQDVAENAELAALRKQIEDLKNEKTKVPVSQAGESAKVTSDKSKEEKNEGLRSSAGYERPTSRATLAEKDSNESIHNDSLQNRAPTVGGSADCGPEGQASGATRPPASAGNAAASALKNGADKGALGLTLSKNGELILDPSNILENPNEGDIALFMERTKGEPFIIREKGELVKISPLLDAAGKPVLTSDGKIKFKKVKLSKAQQELIAKETNVTKAAKEIGVEPVRLFKLKTLLKEVRRD